MSSPRSVLVVDDNEMICRIAVDLLKHHGYSAIFSIGPGPAKEMLSSFIPDLIILDFFMPDMDGDAFIQWLKKHADHRLHNIPVLGLSISQETEERFRVAGANAFIAKPFKEGSLLTAVEVLLGLKGWKSFSTCASCELHHLRAEEGRLRAKGSRSSPCY